jgi:hypothetical protein
MAFRTIVAIACVLTMLGSVICMICGSYHGVRAAYYRRPDAPYRWLVALNPFNAAWFSDQLDEVGLRHRREAFKFQRRAIACMGIVAALGIVLFLTQ